MIFNKHTKQVKMEKKIVKLIATTGYFNYLFLNLFVYQLKTSRNTDIMHIYVKYT